MCYIFSFSADIYLFKVNCRNARKRCEICSKLTIKAPFYFGTYFRTFSSLSITDFERMLAGVSSRQTVRYKLHIQTIWKPFLIIFSLWLRRQVDFYRWVSKILRTPLILMSKRLKSTKNPLGAWIYGRQEWEWNILIQPNCLIL